MSSVLRDFIIANREEIIDRTRERVRERTPPQPTDLKLEHGIPLFLSQLIEALAPVADVSPVHLVGAPDAHRDITESAARHGRELLRNGLSVAQVVRCYGDVCQVVTGLASETKDEISPEAFHVFNRCLDDAIAGAVTAYANQRERDLAYAGTERLGVFAHELRNLLGTAVLSFDAIRRGTVGLGGSTGAVLARSLSGLSALIERSLAEVRLEAAPMFQRVSMLEFMEEIAISAALQADGAGLELTITSLDSDVEIDADRQLLASAVSNVLHNAFKFSRTNGRVTLVTRATRDRVLIEVHDECGGLPPGKAEQLFRPFTQKSTNRSGLGLGLSIALNAVRANSGELSVRDVPGDGCVFTIDLPRSPGSTVASLHAPERQASG